MWTGDSGCKMNCTLLGQVLARYMAWYLSGTCQDLTGTCQVLTVTCHVPGRYLARYLTGTWQALVRHFLGTCHVLDQARWMLCNCQADWSAGKLSRSWQNSKLTDRWLVPSKGWTSSCSHWGTPMTTLPLTAAWSAWSAGQLGQPDQLDQLGQLGQSSCSQRGAFRLTCSAPLIGKRFTV